MKSSVLFDFLNQHEILYHRFDHPPVFTCEEAKELVPQIDGAQTKNLFLRDGKGRRHFIVSVKPEKSVSLKELGKLINANGLGFASAERLAKHLCLTPGSVTLLGVINDNENCVEVIIDQEIWDSAAILCHPLINTSTLRLPKEQLVKFLELTKHSPRVLEIPGVSS